MRRLALLLAPLLLAGCASLQQLAAGALDPPRLRLERASVAAVDLEGATLVLDFTVDNPNGLSLDVAGATWRLAVEGAEVAEGDLPGGVALPARGTAPFAVTVRLRWADAARLAEQVRHQPEVAWRVEGTIDVEWPAGRLSLPYRHQGRLPVPELPAVRLAGASLEVVSFTELEVDLSLDVTNPNEFLLPGATLRFDLLLNGVVVATAREATLRRVDAHGEARLVVPVRVSLVGAGRAAGTMHGGGKLQLRGTVSAGGLERRVELELDLGKR
jgi:LEA14-like dessication related protein